VFALNSLLHVPKESFSEVLRDIHALLRPSGLFYLGVYGGEDSEGPHPNDSHEPPRFFSFYADRRILELVRGAFQLTYFRRVELETPGRIHFQSMILRKGVAPSAAGRPGGPCS
jgi:hypothetical protein